MTEIFTILEELRSLVAVDNVKKDNVLLDLLDALIEAISKIDSIPNKSSTLLPDLLPLEAILKETTLSIRTIIDSEKKERSILNNKIVDLISILKVDNSKELQAINETLKNRPITKWTFNIQRDKNGNMISVIANPNK